MHGKIHETGEEDFDEKCYGEMMEMIQWCTPGQLNWLSDLWHHMDLIKDPSVFGQSSEINLMSDEFDNPEFRQKTY